MHYPLDLGKLGEHTINVEYDYYPGTPGRMYMPNGDPGYPDEPNEYDVTGLMWEDGTFITGCLRGLIYEHLMNDNVFADRIAQEFYDNSRAAAADFAYEQRRDNCD